MPRLRAGLLRRRGETIAPERKLPNWLLSWTELFKGSNIPEQNIIWSGAFAIAAAMQARVFFDRGYRKVHPNLYIWVVGQAATGKSIPAELASEMLRLLPGLFVHSGELTKLYMLNALQASVLHKQLIPPPKKGQYLPTIADPAVIIYHDELATGVGSDALAFDFLKHMVQMYTVPGHYDYGTDKHGLIAIERPLINWIACTTVPWLKRAIPIDIMDSGLTARVNTITAPFPKDPGYDVVMNQQLWNDLVHDLIIISQLEGQFTLDQLAVDKRNEQIRIAHYTRAKMNDDMVQSLYGREDDQALKIAMALSASVRDDLIITESIINSAYKMVNDARDNSVDLYVESSTEGGVQFKMRVANAIKRAPLGIITRKRLIGRVSRYGSASLVDLAVDSLFQEGTIKIHSAARTHGTIYEWKGGEEDGTAGSESSSRESHQERSPDDNVEA
jgi:hypothetical protein